MRTFLLPLIALGLTAASPSPFSTIVAGQASAAQSSGRVAHDARAPSEIVAAAPASDWVAIAASDLLVMDLPPLGTKPRRVVIQLMPPPFSQGWVGNIRTLAAAKWWDGTSINRVQDNYVVQWGDATEKKALPGGLAKVPQSDYELAKPEISDFWAVIGSKEGRSLVGAVMTPVGSIGRSNISDPYASAFGFVSGLPLGIELRYGEEEREGPPGKLYTFRVAAPERVWPIHCYGMVGVGRNLSPDTGSGAELYTVIGHAPRHLDRNIALVGRVIEGIEHLSSLPRGTEALGFYKTAEERTAIKSIRIGAEIADLPRYEYLSTESASFARYADARANRRDPFFNIPAGGADICNIPVPVRRVTNR